MVKKNTDVSDCLGTLKRLGYKMTSARKAILNVLSHTIDHLTAEDVYLQVHKIYPDIGLASVYRTLDLLVRIGIVFKLDFGLGKAEYELAEDVKGKKHHHHLVCTGCGQVIDYKDFSKEELESPQKNRGRAPRPISLRDNESFDSVLRPLPSLLGIEIPCMMLHRGRKKVTANITDYTRRWQ